VRLFWWNTVPNLGDVLTRLLLEHYGHEVEWASPAEAEFVGTGSVLEHFDRSAVTLWGTGRAGRTAPLTDLSGARVLALRGIHTLALVRGSTVDVLGDPGLLVTDIVPPPDKRYGTEQVVAIVPHWQDRDRARATYPSCEFVDVMGDPVQAITQIAHADRVVSSSLHGLVLADAYGLPRMWDWFDGVQGHGFKFGDYFSVMGECEPGQWKQSPRALAVKEELRDCLGVMV